MKGSPLKTESSLASTQNAGKDEKDDVGVTDEQDLMDPTSIAKKCEELKAFLRLNSMD